MQNQACRNPMDHFQLSSLHLKTSFQLPLLFFHCFSGLIVKKFLYLSQTSFSKVITVTTTKQQQQNAISPYGFQQGIYLPYLACEIFPTICIRNSCVMSKTSYLQLPSSFYPFNTVF